MAQEERSLTVVDQVPRDMVPAPPQEADPQLLETTRQSAAQLAEDVLAKPEDLNLLSHLTRIGEEAQKQAGGFFEMRRVTVTEMMNKVKDGSHNPLPGQIKQMRAIMEKFDPRGFKDQMTLAQKYGGKGIKNALVRTMRGSPSWATWSVGWPTGSPRSETRSTPC
jgi:uncharacterized protein YaaN involved in tellurite resistance